MAVNVAQRAKAWLTQAWKRASLPLAPTQVWSTWSGVTWQEYSFDRLSHEGYRLNAAVNICVQKLVTAYQQAPIMLKDGAGNVITRPQDAPMLALLRQPNPFMSWHELAIYIELYKAIGGVCRLYKVRDDRGRLLELWPYHVGQIVAVPGSQSWIGGYRYVGGGSDAVDIPVDDILDLGWPSVDPRAPWLPLPPLMAIAREVDTDSEASRYQYALLANDAVPLTMIKVKRQLGDKQFERLQAQFNQRHGGANRGRVAVLEEEAEIQRMGLNLEEMAFEALRYVPEARIAAAFGVPAMYSGLNVGLQQSTYNNMSEARTAFFQDTIVPQAMLDDGELGAGLTNEFPGDWTVLRDWTQTPALQENIDAIYTRELNAFQAGTTMRNEARRRMGLCAVEEITLPLGVPAYPADYGYQFCNAPPTIPAEFLPPMKTERHILSKALQYTSQKSREARIATAVQAYLEDQYALAAREIEVLDG